MNAPTSDAGFLCYYCGLRKPAAEASDEHIVPSCIGGNRNVTLTTHVCTTCNQFAGDNVDRPFCRDWFIENARLLAGVVHRGKRPSASMGQLQWSRPETVGVLVLEGGAHILVIEGVDGERRLAIGLNEADPTMVEHVRKVIRDKFAGLKVVNDRSPHSPYEEELAAAVIAHGAHLRVTSEVDLTAWHREIVKMALGLSCLTLGEAFISSKGAATLRSFLFENDKEKRDLLQLRGCAGIGRVATPRLTKFWHPGGREHLLALMTSGDKLGFAVNLFGMYENVVEVDDTGVFQAMLPGTAPRGVFWVVDPEAKTTTSPRSLESLLTERAKNARDSS